MWADVGKYRPRWFDNAPNHLQPRWPAEAFHAFLRHILAVQMQTPLRRSECGSNHRLSNRIGFERHRNFYEILSNLRQFGAFIKDGSSRIRAASIAAAKQNCGDSSRRDELHKLHIT